MNDHTLPGTWAEIWQVLSEGVARRDAGARLVSLATLSPHGPQCRTLALRSALKQAGEVTLHTDQKSKKVAELEYDPRVSILVWDPKRKVQLRLNGEASVSRGSDANWQAVPEPSREAYGHIPSPGTPIPSSDAWRIEPDIARFTVITARLNTIDYVSLDPAGHRRALFERTDAWKGQWLSP